MRSRLFNTIVVFSTALASSSVGCSAAVDAGANSDASDKSDGVVASGEGSSRDASGAQVPDGATMDANVHVDGGWPPTK